MRSPLMHNLSPNVLFKAEYRVLNFNTARGVIRKEDPTWDGGGGERKRTREVSQADIRVPPPPHSALQR
jgi:hypothetical protein